MNRLLTLLMASLTGHAKANTAKRRSDTAPIHLKLGVRRKMRPNSVSSQLESEIRFIEHKMSDLKEIMKSAGLPSDRSEIESVASGLLPKPNPTARFPRKAAPLRNEIIQIAARAFNELDEFKKRSAKSMPHVGGNPEYWSIKVGATIDELRTLVTNRVQKKMPEVSDRRFEPMATSTNRASAPASPNRGGSS